MPKLLIINFHLGLRSPNRPRCSTKHPVVHCTEDARSDKYQGVIPWARIQSSEKDFDMYRNPESGSRVTTVDKLCLFITKRRAAETAPPEDPPTKIPSSAASL